MARRRVTLVPHTHWDREWYQPFQAFRLRLVEVLDRLLDLLEHDPSYGRFLLDGQMAALDDYLEVRPEAEERVRRLVLAGRLSVGPWYVLMDEFLVSGETLVRDLELGLERAAVFGGAMEVGYLPDMFGHVAQMPQLLRLAGFEHAVVWRGVPSAIERDAFLWSAPDGSTVRAEYLVHGYGNGSAVPDDAKALVRRLAAYAEEAGSFSKGRILFMNGTDHEAPQPWLGRVVREANELQDDFELVVASLPEALAEGDLEGLPRWTGELRSGARANLLMGVASNRVDVKQAAARTERELERRAEPLAALFLPPERWPQRLLRIAWREVVRNAAHDSVCACSVDEVAAAVLHRYAEARQIAEGVARQALSELASSFAEAGPVVVNPSARPRGGLVEVVVPGEGPIPHAQLLSTRPAVLLDRTLTAGEARMLLSEVRSQQVGAETYLNAIEVEEDERGIEVVVHADARPRKRLEIEQVKRDLTGRLAARPDAPVHVRVLQPPSRRLLARVEEVPGFGWRRFEPAPPAHPVAAEGASLRNGLVTVDVDPEDGTFSLDGVAGMGRLVDGGDRGDTYNWCPPEPDTLVDRPDAVEVEVLEAGPLRGRLRVSRVYTWPARLDDRTGTRVGAETVTVVTLLELRADEHVLRVEVRFENRCRDHRLRMVFPLPEPAAVSEAECAFAVVRRGLDAEGGPTERPLATFPSRRFVRAGGLTVVHEGLLEYELVDLRPTTGQTEGQGAPRRAHALALTLLRATGAISRLEMPTRPLPAGPPIPVEGPQLLGPREARLAVATGAVDPYGLVDDVFLPLEVVRAHGGGDRPPTGSALTVSGAEVSALRRRAGGLELRVFNPTPSPAQVGIPGRSGWLCDLRGRPLQAFEDGFALRPFGIATAFLPDERP